jgi:hypothetical protein
MMAQAPLGHHTSSKLAFGISAQESVTVENNHKNITEATDSIPTEKNRTQQLKEILQHE